MNARIPLAICLALTIFGVASQAAAQHPNTADPPPGPTTTAPDRPPPGVDSVFNGVTARDQSDGEETGGGEGARDDGVVTLRCDDAPARVSRTGSYILDGNRFNYIDGMAFQISLATGQVRR